MVLFSLFITVFIILILVNFKVNLGLTLLISSILLLIFNSHNPIEIITLLKETLEAEVTIKLLLAVTFISMLSKFMSEYKILDRMIDSLEGILRSVKATMLIAPPMMGLLLVSGGALLSAPVIENLGDRLGFKKDKSAAINMIFRHGLYFIYPLSTTIILTSTLAGFPISEFIKYMFPTAVALYVFGYIVLLKGVKDVRAPKTSFKGYIINLLNFIYYSMPLSVSILLTIAFKLELYLAMIVGIILSLIIHINDRMLKSNTVKVPLKELIIKGVNYQMLITLFGMFLFKNTVQSLDGIELALNQLLSTGIPLELVIIGFTLLLSLATGSIQPSVALLIPLIIPLASNSHQLVMYSVLIYVSGFMGYFISPLHMCQVVTCQYFQIKTRDIYYYYKFIFGSTYLVSIIIYLIIMYI